MSDRTQRVLDRVAEVGFTTRLGTFAPFGEELPLVTGVAWEPGTGQLALVAEMATADSDEAWQQLLFAVSGVRHQLTNDGPTAYGTPLVLAIADDEGVRRLRGISEDLADRFAIFSRVDLNLVRLSALDDEDALDLALAPLLPKCRELMGNEISRVDVERFWERLRHHVAGAASNLDDVFSDHREAAAEAIAGALIGDLEQSPELPPPHPIASLTLRNFRSFRDDRIDLAPVTVLHGPNGGGKSSVVEALELLWAGRSQRMPAAGDESEREAQKTEAAYQRALVRDGADGFTVTGDGSSTSAVASQEGAELRRSVLGQETVGRLVDRSPLNRFAALLSTTGLELPDLDGRTRRLVTEAKAEADRALAAAGLPPLPRASSAGLKHLRSNLGGGFPAPPDPGELVALQAVVAETCGGLFEGRPWGPTDEVNAALARADRGIADVLSNRPADDLESALADAAALVRGMARERVAAAAQLRALMEGLDAAARRGGPSSASEAPAPTEKPTLPPELAVRWMSHANSVREAAGEFRRAADADDLTGKWADRLRRYADALENAAATAPLRDLQKEVRSAPAPQPLRPADLPQLDGLFRAAGFTESVSLDAPGQAALAELHGALTRHADVLFQIGDVCESHPAKRFPEHSSQVLRAICRFELARAVRGSGPILRAADDLVGDLLESRLAPVLRELVAAIVRFEWYFKPLKVVSTGRQIVLGGLATEQEDLDARLVLNAAERTVVGVAWFLALHYLQPPERRRVLVLDDPTGAFDAVNQSGLLTTLRAFIRLARPEQVVISTHDDALGAIIAEELAPVDGWPSRVARVRIHRDEHDASVHSPQESVDQSRQTAAEADALGLEGGAARLFAE